MRIGGSYYFTTPGIFFLVQAGQTSTQVGDNGLKC